MADKELVQFSDAEAGVAIKKIVKAGVSLNKGLVIATMFGKGPAKVKLRSTGDVKISGSGTSAKYRLTEAEMAAIGFSKSFGTEGWSVNFECGKADVNGMMLCATTFNAPVAYGTLRATVNLEEIDRRFDEWLRSILMNPNTPIGTVGDAMSLNSTKRREEEELRKAGLIP
jgi:hypothetical protein